jgi:hypothetical protein
MNQSAIDKIAKDLYPQDDINKLVIEKSALLGMIKKRQDFVGRRQVVGLRYATPSGRSAILQNAITNSNPSKLEGFYVTRIKDYAVASIDTETIRSADGKKGSIVEALDIEIGGALEALRRSMAISIFRNQGGSIGKLDGVGAVGTVGPFSLTVPEDISNFEAGMSIQLAVTDGTTGTVKPGLAVIAKVDRNLGQFTTVGLLSTGIGTAASTDYIFYDGDFGVRMAGLAAWIPQAAPTTAPFFGVDRTQDAERLAGVRPTVTTGAPIEIVLQQALGQMARNMSEPDTIFLNPTDWMQLVVSLGSKLVIQKVHARDTADISFDAVVIAGPKGMVKVLSDPNCPKGIAYILQMDTWCLWTLGPVGFLDEDGLRMLRGTLSDDYTWRMGYYGNLVCDAPGWNAVVTL